MIRDFVYERFVTKNFGPCADTTENDLNICIIDLVFRQISPSLEDCVAFVYGLCSLLSKKGPTAPKQRPHNLLEMLKFCQKVFLI